MGSRRRRRCAISVQAAAVFLGGLWGLAVPYPGRPPTVYTALAAVAAFMVISGLWSSLAGPRIEEYGHPALGASGCLAYMAGAVFFEPFILVHGLSAVAGAALMLVPLLLAVAYLAQCRAWLAAAGGSLFVFASSAMLAGNAGAIDAGSGFLWYWRSG